MCEVQAGLWHLRPAPGSTNKNIFSSALAYTAELPQAASDNAGGMLLIEGSFFSARTIGKILYVIRRLNSYWRKEGQGPRHLSLRTGMPWKSINPTHFTTSNRYWDCMSAR